ncbi:porin family protein [Epilithonimonas mollis]|uniref:Outer membrane protein beta-barrel domain-containing protein n=1 Tax=Epilithonimonas mollis TaxID=216903 RepID=A0A1M6T8B1_9FLAO|nr:porin family protein [Epilithonimonas mollis]SHK53231.1 Outer membrane protein beta-barrel domain-containing protein [Epilithonimonas mollis]
MQPKILINVKKLLLVGAVALFGAVNAQTKFGVKAGYALSTMNVNENDLGALKSKSGFYVGALVEHSLTEKFALQAELQYANLGAKVEESESGITVTENINMNRILLPVSAKYFVTPNFGIYGGPFVSFKASNKVKIKVKGTSVDAGTQDEINEYEKMLEDYINGGLKSSEFGLFFGAEVKVYKGLFADARYSFGLSNQIKDPVDGEKSKLNFFQVGLGYKF